MSSQNLFQKTLHKSNSERPPIWLMRQAGRYHSHYQNIRKDHSFIEMCKNSDLAAEVTMGPIQDFDFDAAILFSDLLFPLETLGMGLRYTDGVGPELDWHIETLADVNRLAKKSSEEVRQELSFQKDALIKIRHRLAKSKGLIGFVGGPLTLFFYAAFGSHKRYSGMNTVDAFDSSIRSADVAMNGNTKVVSDKHRFEAFCEVLRPLLLTNLDLQVEGGPDVICMMDTAAGELPFELYKKVIFPETKKTIEQFKSRNPASKIMYYSKGTNQEHWNLFRETSVDGIGVDWNIPMKTILPEFSDRFVIQGNVNPDVLHYSKEKCESFLRSEFEELNRLPSKFRQGYILGLGHGVLQHTPEENVRTFVRLGKEIFGGK